MTKLVLFHSFFTLGNERLNEIRWTLIHSNKPSRSNFFTNWLLHTTLFHTTLFHTMLFQLYCSILHYSILYYTILRHISPNDTEPLGKFRRLCLILIQYSPGGALFQRVAREKWLPLPSRESRQVVRGSHSRSLPAVCQSASFQHCKLRSNFRESRHNFEQSQKLRTKSATSNNVRNLINIASAERNSTRYFHHITIQQWTSIHCLNHSVDTTEYENFYNFLIQTSEKEKKENHPLRIDEILTINIWD